MPAITERTTLSPVGVGNPATFVNLADGGDPSGESADLAFALIDQPGEIQRNSFGRCRETPLPHAAAEGLEIRPVGLVSGQRALAFGGSGVAAGLPGVTSERLGVENGESCLSGVRHLRGSLSCSISERYRA
jgi:hypothetical protein